MNAHKIALFGAPGEATRRLTTEALRRGHQITVIADDEKELPMKHPNLKVVKGDVRKKEDVKRYAIGNDTVICAHEPTLTNPNEHVEITRSVLAGVKGTGIHNLISVAHPFAEPAERSQKEVDDLKPVVKAQQEALKLFQNEKEIQWGYAHSAESKKATGTTGKYPSTREVLLSNPEGESRIPVKEYASAILDEAEKGEMEFHHGEENWREF